MLTDESLHNSLKVTFIYVFVSTQLQLAVALAIALLLNEGMKGLPFGLTGLPDAIRRTRRSSSRFRHPGPSRCSPRYEDAPLAGAWLISPLTRSKRARERAKEAGRPRNHLGIWPPRAGSSAAVQSPADHASRGWLSR